LIESVKRLNQFVHSELSKESPQELQIFAEALRVARSVIRGAEIMDVRLLDDKTNELYFAETYGRGWNQGDEHEIELRRLRRFPVAGEVRSAGAHVFLTKRPYVVYGSSDPYYSETFPNTNGMIIAPIGVEEETYGVLDIRATGAAFPRNAETMAELIGQQLGLYHYLARTIGHVRRAESELKKNVQDLEALRRQQAQAFQDLEHQLKSPITQAYARVQALFRETTNERLRSEIGKIRGLCGKAKRVAMSTGLFARLARGELTPTKPRPLSGEDIVKLAIEAADDNQVLIDPERGISFHVDRFTFHMPRNMTIKADSDLIQWALNALLDNAAKYTYPRTQVHIQAGMTGTERFHITIANKGLPIRPNEVRECVIRGWRGGRAQAATGEGSGIGLWIVDNIMKAHGGNLIIVPTTFAGVTEVKLVFPTSKDNEQL
jgi:K+-sensing histidine kinase KdpD